MSESKLKRLVAAGTATGIIMLFILIIVMAYQIVAMGNKKREVERLQAEITELQKEIENGENEKNKWLTKWKIEERARQIGYIYKNDN